MEEEVGRETRNIEFKAAYTTLRERGNGLFDLVGKYVCGFLNSTEGGTLYFGVDDSGKVRGSLCSRGEEDKVRQIIDQSIRTIEPSVFPTSYRVHFCPVMEETGYLSDNLQVLEIEVYPTKSQGRLYDFKGHIYMRRDGSLQGPLKGREVQEWIRTYMETVTAAEHAGEPVGKQLHVLNMLLAAEQDKNKVLMQQVAAEREKNEALTKQLERLSQY
ncbi:hypothetical protein C0Q70_07187 [Pomacea canaliculata]|uniref:Schlafen AlbA-2 domain-containing protein n=2 Tax=Pomacea canaliculata TaxID=400727 RepID=A0A2T7PEC1_POMCA|nr:hypothetical protein C0Q70_07187 [Pomacea canaliculata]